MNDRALANNMFVFLGTLALVFVVGLVIEPVVLEMVEIQAAYTSTDAAAKGQEYQRSVVHALPYIGVGLAVLLLIASAAAEEKFT